MRKKVSTTLSVFIILVIMSILLLNHYMSYSVRIGNTQFFLVETMAMSKDGKPLLGLYCKVASGGYKGVEMSGFPRFVLWNDKYLISKNCDGTDTTITSYVVIDQKSANLVDGDISDLRVFKTEVDYNKYIRQIGLSESEMKQVDNHIAWWKLPFI